MEQHVYSEAEAQRILDEFPQAKLRELLVLAWRAKRDFKSVDRDRDRPSLPEGWDCAMYANCIIVRYQDGQQERKRFFVPNIFIEFEFASAIEARKSVLTRYEIGYCSCGKPIPMLQKMLWAADMIDRKGVLCFPHRALGYTAGATLVLWAYLRPVHWFSLGLNRHPECL